MPEQPIIPSQEGHEIQPNPPKYELLGNFLLGAFFGAIPVFVGLDLSSYMTHTPWFEYDVWKLAIAASIPFVSGALGVALKGRFLKALGDVLSSTVI